MAGGGTCSRARGPWVCTHVHTHACPGTHTRRTAWAGTDGAGSTAATRPSRSLSCFCLLCGREPPGTAQWSEHGWRDVGRGSSRPRSPPVGEAWLAWNPNLGTLLVPAPPYKQGSGGVKRLSSLVTSPSDSTQILLFQSVTGGIFQREPQQYLPSHTLFAARCRCSSRVPLLKSR